ncbi:MAG: DGQHR domain-containing protein DpdB [Myxococcota bacterium]
MPAAETIAIPAIEMEQSKGRRLYTFAIDGKLVPRFAAISRIKRTDATRLLGYQRPEVYSHIEEIRNYLETSSPMIPNGIVIAFDTRVKFRPSSSKRLTTGCSRMGSLQIPLATKGQPRAGFVVDGQQRLAAIREAHIKSFPIFVNAFITDDVRTQTEQFILVNSTKPLPKGLLYELLPSTDARLPTQLHRRRLPAQLLERLNHDDRSPFYHMVRTPTSPEGMIKDNSMLKMLSNSLSDGALFRYRSSDEGAPDVDTMFTLLCAFWAAVEQTFPEAWGVNSRRSRLMHGAGIVAVGNLMDHLVAKYSRKTLPSTRYFAKHLALVAPYCAWTRGTWKIPKSRRKWNEIQNTRQDVALLTEHLQRCYDHALSHC